MSIHLYTNGAWTDSGKIYRNSLNLINSSEVVLGTIDQSGNEKEWDQGYRSGWMRFNLDVPINISGLTGPVRVFIYNSNKIYQNINFLYSEPFSYNYDGYFRLSGGLNWFTTNSTMVNDGDTDLPFEPYNVVDWYTNTGHGYSSGAWD